MSGRFRRFSAIAALSGAVGLAVVSIALAATKAINLDGQSANGAESAVALNILASFPARVEDKVTNRSVGTSYTFRWPSAGPGGFSSQLAPGTTAGVGVTWVWQTAQTIYTITGNSCANDICFTKVAGPASPPTNPPAWVVPGRTLVPNSVTLSAGSLTSSLISFFSPPQTLVTATNSVNQLPSGEFAFGTTYTNNTPNPITIEVPPGPVGCCESPYQLYCDGKCIEPYTDEHCFACDNDCTALDCGEGVGYCDGKGGGCYCGGYGGATFGSPSLDDELVTAPRSPRDRPAFGDTSVRGSEVIVGPYECGGVDYAPLCETSGFTAVIPASGSITDCQTSNYLPKEIPGVLTVCGASIPDGEPTCPGGDRASQGTFMQFIPDLNNPVPTYGAYLTPFEITVADPSGDGVLQPGETGTLFISVINVGPTDYTEPAADLLSPPVDMTDNGVNDPAAVLISQFSSEYAPDVQGLVPAPDGNCAGPFAPAVPSTNVVAYSVTVPPDHPGDVVRPFTLEFTGNVDGTPTQLFVPLSLGIGSAEADLEITKQANPPSPTAGGNITYTLGVTNHGPLDAANVVVSDEVPAGTTFVSLVAQPGWDSCATPSVGGTGTVSCERGALTAGATSSITLVVKVTTACPSPTSVTNTATVSSDTPDELTENNSATSVNPVAAPAPVVEITQPVADQLGLPPLSIPVTIRFQTTSASPIARETVSLEGCLLWDGATYGDRDGLLTDEAPLQTNKYMLCQAMARCGYNVLYYPRIRVAATDNCGRTGTDDVIYRKNLLKTQVCAP